MSKEKIDIELVKERLKDVQDPELNRSIVELGMLEDVEVKKNKLKIRIKLTIPGCPLKDKISNDVRDALVDVPGIEEIKIEFSSMNEEERKALTNQMTGKDHSAIFASRGVKNVVLVASGKGGVGKSTVTAILAITTAKDGYSVGILDADIHGFSIPRILGATGQPTILDNTIIPIESHGIKIISMGFFMKENEAVLWRGPMIHKAVSQFLSDVFWDDLDYLFIDLPPGTGDVAMSLAQNAPGVNAVLVTTPQPGAFIVASRIARLLEKFEIKLLGVIENMSYFLAPNGNKEYIFGSGGGEELAGNLNVPLLGNIPLDTVVRQGGDDGCPITVSDENNPAAVELGKISKKMIRSLMDEEKLSKTAV